MCAHDHQFDVIEDWNYIKVKLSGLPTFSGVKLQSVSICSTTSKFHCCLKIAYSMELLQQSRLREHENFFSTICTQASRQL